MFSNTKLLSALYSLGAATGAWCGRRGSVSAQDELVLSYASPPPPPPEIESESIEIPILVEEIIEEILSRQPVRSLLRFRCVSKSWRSLITSERFVEIHLRKSTKNRAFSHHRVIFKCNQFQSALNQCSLLQLLNKPSSIEPSSSSMDGIVMGCCNGLLLIRKGLDFWLWNPATRISITLPKLGLNCETTKFGFGWDETSGAYKVFVHDSNWEVWLHGKGKAYSSKTNSWKTVDRGNLYVHDRLGVFACGKIHWLTNRQDCYIESWDLENEEFGRIELPFNPPKFRRQRSTLAEIGGCLHLMSVHVHDHDDHDDDDDDDDQQSHGVVWVMKECGWLKLFTLILSFVPPHLLLISPLFGGGPNGEIFVIFRENYFVYSTKDDVVLQAGENIFGFYQGHVYVESLVSPNFTR